MKIKLIVGILFVWISVLSPGQAQTVKTKRNRSMLGFIHKDIDSNFRIGYFSQPNCFELQDKNTRLSLIIINQVDSLASGKPIETQFQIQGDTIAFYWYESVQTTSIERPKNNYFIRYFSVKELEEQFYRTYAASFFRIHNEIIHIGDRAYLVIQNRMADPTITVTFEMHQERGRQKEVISPGMNRIRVDDMPKGVYEYQIHFLGKPRLGGTVLVP